MSAIHFEPEMAARIDAIRAVHCEAFPTAQEADLVDRLRADGDLALSRLAVAGDTVVGHVAFSPMTAPMKALGLGPVAVLSAHQGSGIGSALIRDAVRCVREAGWEAVFVLGDAGFYERFGFSIEAAAKFASPYAGPHFMALELRDGALAERRGAVEYARAFAALG